MPTIRRPPQPWKNDPYGWGLFQAIFPLMVSLSNHGAVLRQAQDDREV